EQLSVDKETACINLCVERPQRLFCRKQAFDLLVKVALDFNVLLAISVKCVEIAGPRFFAARQPQHDAASGFVLLVFETERLCCCFQVGGKCERERGSL